MVSFFAETLTSRSSSKSHLFPIKIKITSDVVYRRTSSIHLCMLRNVERFVMSYTVSDHNFHISLLNLAIEFHLVRDITYNHTIRWSIIALCYGTESLLSYKLKRQRKHKTLKHIESKMLCVMNTRNTRNTPKYEINRIHATFDMK